MLDGTGGRKLTKVRVDGPKNLTSQEKGADDHCPSDKKERQKIWTQADGSVKITGM